MLEVLSEPPPLFRDPAELLSFYHPDFQTGHFAPYPCQVKILRSYANKKPGKAKKITVCANNGSGKSKVILAAAIAWTAVTFNQALCVVTTASGAQLDLQTFRGLKYLAQQMNAYHGADLWEIQYRHLKFRPQASNVEGRVTDDSFRMEGFHPENPGKVFAIFLDEAKGIPQDIYSGIVRWTGSTHKLEVSSPGEPAGDFYHNCISGAYEFFKITAHDCPHISEEEKREIIARYGESHPLTRSILWAEFTNIDGTLVITYDKVVRCIRMGKEDAIVWKPDPFNRAGIDFSGGGDEMILSVWNGNKQLALESIPNADEPYKAVAYLITRFEHYSLKPENIFGDAGGMGKPYISMCREKGYPINAIYAQGKTIAAKHNWGNRGTEMFYNFVRMIEECQLILIDDTAQTNQLSNRYFKRSDVNNRIILESKGTAKFHGHPSPDRADAAVLANARYKYDDGPAASSAIISGRRRLTLAELQDLYDGEGLANGMVAPIFHGTPTIESLTGKKKVVEKQFSR